MFVYIEFLSNPYIFSISGIRFHTNDKGVYPSYVREYLVWVCTIRYFLASVMIRLYMPYFYEVSSCSNLYYYIGVPIYSCNLIRSIMRGTQFSNYLVRVFIHTWLPTRVVNYIVIFPLIFCLLVYLHSVIILQYNMWVIPIIISLPKTNRTGSIFKILWYVKLIANVGAVNMTQN